MKKSMEDICFEYAVKANEGQKYRESKKGQRNQRLKNAGMGVMAVFMKEAGIYAFSQGVIYDSMALSNVGITLLAGAFLLTGTAIINDKTDRNLDTKRKLRAKSFEQNALRAVGKPTLQENRRAHELVHCYARALFRGRDIDNSLRQELENEPFLTGNSVKTKAPLYS